MTEIVLIIAAVLVIAVAVVLILAASKPNEFSFQRSIAIKAPPEKILSLIADFHQWTSWSPYENRDPAMKRGYSGAPAGKGAVYTWNGSNKVGSGRMEILDVIDLSKIIIKLDFLKPFEAHNTAEFILLPQGDATTGLATTDVATTDVTWKMHGPSAFISKVMQVFMNLDRMVGKDFEAGLANLKRVTEN